MILSKAGFTAVRPFRAVELAEVKLQPESASWEKWHCLSVHAFLYDMLERGPDLLHTPGPVTAGSGYALMTRALLSD